MIFWITDPMVFYVSVPGHGIASSSEQIKQDSIAVWPEH